MKRLFSFALLFLTVFHLTACIASPENMADTVTLYYIRSAYQYHSEENVIVGEERSYSPAELPVEKLLEMYMEGPVGDGIEAPVPEDTQIIDILNYSGVLEVTLSDTEHALTDAGFSLACVCIGKTLFDNTDIIQVTFFSGDRFMTVTRDNFLITDEVKGTQTQKETTP
jgi:hypothetical protein